MGSYFLIELITDGVSSYYARGMFLRNIPLEKADSVRLLFCFHRDKGFFCRNIMPAFIRFQHLWKAWYKIIKNPRTYLLREIGDTRLKRFSPRKHLQ